MTDFSAKDIIKISLAIGFLIIPLSIGYYFVFFLPSQAKEKAKWAEDQRAEKQRDETMRQSELETCLNSTSEQYMTDTLEFVGSAGNFRDTIFNYTSLRIHTRNYKKDTNQRNTEPV